MKNIIFIFCCTIAFFSCTKVIDINLNNADKQIVIEGEISNQAGPYLIKISETVNFSESNNYPPVKNAQVYVEDNFGNKDTLIETTPGFYYTQQITGVPGRIYSLKIITSEKTLTAKCQMPNIIPLDTIRFLKSNFGGGGPGGSTEINYAAIPEFLDPPTLGNCYRFIQKANDTLDKNFNVDNDNLINGLKYQRPIFSQGFTTRLNDTFTLEMQNIDVSIYNYFNSLNESIGSGPGGGATPANPVSNIEGGALGYFSAHTSQKKTVIVK
jgi:hypothetical protein